MVVTAISITPDLVVVGVAGVSSFAASAQRPERSPVVVVVACRHNVQVWCLSCSSSVANNLADPEYQPNIGNMNMIEEAVVRVVDNIPELH